MVGMDTSESILGRPAILSLQMKARPPPPMMFLLFALTRKMRYVWSAGLGHIY
jgi:hypothetical protein